MGFQSCTILGNVGKEPELKYLADGTAITEFPVAVNEKYGQKETVTWFTVKMFGKLAELAVQYVNKGKELLLVGQIRTRTWDKPDGGKGYAWELVARDMTFVGKADTRGDQGGDESDLPFED